jgi:hypothetical protein
MDAAKSGGSQKNPSKSGILVSKMSTQLGNPYILIYHANGSNHLVAV